MARPKKGEEKDRSEAVGFRISPWVRAGLDRLASEHGIPISDVMHDAMEAYLKRHGIKEPR
jgi:predicted transcriptional regulator